MVRWLRQRGLSVSSCESPDGTFLPYLDGAKGREEFFTLLHSYPFRLFLRDILAQRDRFLPERLGPFFTPASVREMARRAESLGILARGRGNRIRLVAAGVTDFGDTFEWYVAQRLARQFGADALWGVTVPDLPCGGDFDVLAILSGKLLLLEAKTSPPKHIERREMDAFVRRVRVLSPDLAVFLVDTHLRMKDKLAPMLSESLAAAGVRDGEVNRVEREVFGWDRRLYLGNSKRDVAGNLALCFRDHFLDRFFD